MRSSKYNRMRRQLHTAWDLMEAAVTSDETRCKKNIMTEVFTLARSLEEQLQWANGVAVSTATKGISHRDESEAVARDSFSDDSRRLRRTRRECTEILTRVGRELLSNRPTRDVLVPMGLAIVYSLILLGVATVAAAGIASMGRAHNPWGLRVTHFRGAHFDVPIAERNELQVLADYRKKRQLPGRVPRDGFSARWNGFLLVPESAEYQFFAQSDDGLRITIDGERIVDNWQDNDWLTSGRHAQVHLEKGQHTIRIEFYSEGPGGALRVKWTGGPIPRNTVLSAPHLRWR